MKLKQIILIIVVSIISFGCNDENPDLVNPPDKTGSIKFRFLNLGLDKQYRSLEVGNGKFTPSIAWGTISPTDNPPADTGFVKVHKNSDFEFLQSSMVRFIRNTNYTYIGLSSKVCADKSTCAVDTLIALRTTSAIPDNNFESLLKFMNAYPDTNIRLSVRLGCPSGDVLFNNQNYKQYSISPVTVRSGNLNFSIVKTIQTSQGITVVNIDSLYTTILEPKGQYTILAHEDQNGSIGISIIDENDLTSNSLKHAQILPLRTTEIRTVNVSDNTIKIGLKGGDIIDPSISNLNIGDFKVVETCKSSLKDTIQVEVGDRITSSISTSLEVLTRYTLVVYDSADVKASGSVLLSPPKLNQDISGKSVIRVVNTLDNSNGLNVSIGARLETDRSIYPNGYSSGIALASRLKYSGISEFSVINPGPSPISVFTAGDPSRLLFAANTYFEPDKQYLVIVTKDINENIKLTVIDEDDQSKPITYLVQGVFFQLINATSDNSTINISLSSSVIGKQILNSADLHTSNSLATVIDADIQSVNINGVELSVNSDIENRVIVIAGGTKNNLNLIFDKFKPLTPEQSNLFRVRFVNATTDLPLINMKKTNNDESFFESIEINTFSSYSVETREQKPSFFYYEGELIDYIGRFSDVTMSLGKSYCIIIYGSSSRECNKYYNPKTFIEPNCYSFIIQQEF